VKAVFRVDASPAIGSGHLRRCLTLAQALRGRGFDSTFVMRRHPGNMNAEAGCDHCLIELPAPVTDDDAVHPWLGASEAADAAQTREALGDAAINLLVVDHYAIGAEWESALRSHADRIAVIDDLADRPHDCDMLVDVTIRDDDPYAGLAPRARHLLGPRYALLRPDFARRRAASVPRRALRRVLVTFGAVDATDYTGRAIRALADSGLDLEIDIVLGAAAPHLASVEHLCATQPGWRLHVDTREMSDLMAAADLAIGAGGTTSWERLCLGVPALATVIADNQCAVVAGLVARGTAFAVREDAGFEAGLIDAVRFLASQPGELARLSRNGAALVDGRGTDRVAAAIAAPAFGLRCATSNDTRDLWTWRNAPEVRRLSRETGEIAWEGHQKWLAGVLADPDRDLLIAEGASGPLGVLRFDRAGDSVEVSIHLTPFGIGQNVGVSILRAGEDWLQKHRPDIGTIVAAIREENAPSLAAFQAAGYEPALRHFHRKIGA